jgi:hypothetical protein
LVLQGNWEHDQLIFVEWFEFFHRSPLSYGTLWLCAGFSHFFDSFNGLPYAPAGSGLRGKRLETEACHSLEKFSKNAQSASLSEAPV